MLEVFEANSPGQTALSNGRFVLSLSLLPSCRSIIVRSQPLLSTQKRMPCRQKQAKPGDVFPVNDSESHYQLPPGLKVGTLVKLLAFDYGVWIVEAGGKQFKVFMMRIESGWEYEWRGRLAGRD